MLPPAQKIAFLIFAAAAIGLGAIGFYRMFLRIRRGRHDLEPRGDRPWRRIRYAVTTTITQQRTFRKRPAVSFFHSLIVYGFLFYILVNLLDGIQGYVLFAILSSNPWGAAYNLCADILTFLVVLGVAALVVRRFLLPSGHDFDFNPKTPLERAVRPLMIRDSAIVSAFIVFHVGSRALEAGAKLKLQGGDSFQPFATLLSRVLPPTHARGLAEIGYWGALGSALAFLAYFPWTKHVHILMAPLKYFFARRANSGELPLLEIGAGVEADRDAGTDLEMGALGAAKLEDLAWPRLLDAYACIQCNRCQDACPASATGKALSPAALEINKRMELNRLGEAGGALAARTSPFERGAPSPRPLLEFALSAEALWACTTCGACMEVCPVQDEQMLDIIDIRRHHVMMEGKFPAPLQAAFRGMERASNPWGISRDQRLAWAEGLDVKTIEENPHPEVLYWVGCAASYDPEAQRTARAFVQLLAHAKVNFAVLGKKEGCTGDSARRAGNEYLYRQLAEENISLLNRVNPPLIVATCPHCMNSIGNEYPQMGGDYRVMHHTEYLDRLIAGGRLEVQPASSRVTYHDPCYLGRHNGIYDAPRNLLRVVTGDLVEMGRARENSFCCGAGGAQFWKEEEPGAGRVSDNRFLEAKQCLGSGPEAKVLAVACPFCKSMLSSTPGRKQDAQIEVADIAELLLRGIKSLETGPATAAEAPVDGAAQIQGPPLPEAPAPPLPIETDSRGTSAASSPNGPESPDISSNQNSSKSPEGRSAPTQRKPWKPKP